MAQDNYFASWSAYCIKYWPARYIINRQGRIVYRPPAKGAYGTIEQTVRRLLDAQS